ncbi:MAG TPA: FAD-binding oxidoreductase [Thermomicrobiales bacterium]|nr:FAD-binding oxidoreductase [Thermomicrobiales bacterium]
MVLETPLAEGTFTSIDAINRLEAAIRGDLIRPSHPHYDQVRALYNAMIDKYPAAIVQALNVADAIATIGFARESGLPLSIRGGGHHGAGLASVDDGVMLDLSKLQGIRVDPVARTVRVEPGCTWADVDHATHAFGLAVPSGTVGSTGVAGLTLGGGIGHLSRRHGLTIDSLLAVDIVLADGRLVTANESDHPDLFWAVRGGGGNFGVVTSFLFRLHPVETIIGGPTFWPIDQAPEVMRWYRDFIATAPEDLNGFFATLTIPPVPPFPEELHGVTMCAVVWCYTGDAASADEAFAPVRTAVPPMIDAIMPMPYPVLQGMFDPLIPAGLQWYWKTHFVKDLPDAAIDAHLAFAATIPTPKSTMHLYPINGAVHRIGRTDTAFAQRDATWAMVIVGIDPDPASAEPLRTWAQDYWAATLPFAAEGAYVNMLTDGDDQRVRAAYQENYPRLQDVKRHYDPNNLFHINLNIRPAGPRST